jgi:hypothetical protein
MTNYANIHLSNPNQDNMLEWWALTPEAQRQQIAFCIFGQGVVNTIELTIKY